MNEKRTKAQAMRRALEAMGHTFVDEDDTDGTMILLGNRISRPPKPEEEATDEEDSNG